MTMTRPLRLMTLHFSQIRFTDGLTFIKVCLLFLIVSLSFLEYTIFLPPCKAFFAGNAKKFSRAADLI
jgi:hypothetical protein